jgi:hypothetical protein
MKMRRKKAMGVGIMMMDLLSWSRSGLRCVLTLSLIRKDADVFGFT